MIEDAVFTVKPGLTARQQDCDAFLRKKVEAARRAMRAGSGLSHDEVEAEFSARRARAVSSR